MMRDRQNMIINAVLALALLLTVGPALAGLPQPMVVYYGQAQDGFGWPYRDHADVILLIGTNEMARHTIDGSISPGVNFALYVHVDDGTGGTNRYSGRAARTGETVRILVQDSYGLKTIMESNSVPAVTKPGDLILVNVTAGVDSDHDGLPDSWEQELLNLNTNPLILTIADIDPDDDFDGDGVPNDEEFVAGTFAFLDYDYFFAEHLEMTQNHCLHIEFLSVPGKIYGVDSTTNVLDGAWAATVFSIQSTGPWQTSPVEGDGDWLSLYVPLSETNRAFRMNVQ